MLEVVKKARSRIMLSNRFFGHLIYQTPIIEAPWVQTAATDMRRIYYNPAFFEGMSVPQVEFVLLHEILHIVGKHGWRRGNRHPGDFNIAGDHFINLFLKAGGYTMPPDGLADPQYADMAVEKIYDLIHKEQPGDPESKPGEGNASGDGESGQGEGQGDPNEGRPDTQRDLVGNDLLEPADHASSQEARDRMQEIDTQVAQAATMARMAGQSSVAMERLVSQVLDAKAPWYELLAEYVTDIIRAGTDWSRRNRRYRKQCLPARRVEGIMGECVMIGDASGSITNKMFNQIGAEAKDICEMLQPERFRMIWATTRVVREDVFERGEELDLKSPESGGTDMRVPLAHVEQYDPQVVILITDGYTPWPDVEPAYPLIVCCTSDADVPIGKVVRV